MKMNINRFRGRTSVLGIFALVLIALMLLGNIPGTNGEWSTSVFEEQIDIERSPDHLEDRAPFNGENLHLTITSKNNQMINAANVWVWVYYQGTLQTEGAFTFLRINQTVMEVDVQGYPGGYNVQYEVNAFDERNSPVRSTRYSYTVIENGSWIDTDFENNIILSWGPQEPANGQDITINITSRDPLVAIERADLFYTVNILDQDPVDGVAYFEVVNSTHMTAKVITYPPGSRISFHVEAYDQYFHNVVSDNFVYEYPRPPILDPVFQGILFIILKDEAENVPANQAVVVFANNTYQYETVTVNGMAFTNSTVYQGDYRIDIIYNGKKVTKTVSVPRNDGSFTFQFGVNQKTYMVADEAEDRPYIREIIGFVLAFGFLIGLFYLAHKIKETREAMNERKKKTRRRVDKEVEDKWYEKLIQDEELKEKVVRCAGILLLSLLGLFWAPFFPWWMVLISAAFLTAIAYKYPFISMLVMAVLVTSAVSYQSKEFGWVFLVFSLIVMIGGFFDWRFAYLSFLTVFAAGFGLGFAVPMVAAVTFSLFLGTTVLITAGLFLLIVTPSGTFQWFSFLAVPTHEKSFVQFDKGIESGWSPIDFINSIGDLTTVDTNILSTVLQETMGSLIPLFGLIGWGLAMVVVYFLFNKWMKEEIEIDKEPKNWAIRLIPAGIIIIFGVISILWAKVEFTVWLIFPFLAVIPATLIPFGIRAVGEEALPMQYGVVGITSSDVGKKISDMVGFKSTSFNDIGGLEDVKREVKNALMVPLLEPEMATKYGVKPSKGLLLFGPPGCGKTLMLKAVASDLNVEMIGVKCSDVMSKWYGESEGLIASLYEEARARSPCILFFDEIDAIAKRRDFYSTDDVTPRVLSIMLSEMDGMDDAEGIIIVATTNMPDLVDPALMRPGRFDKVIYVPPPDKASRGEILKVHLKGKFVSDNIDTGTLAKSTKGFSGADLANLVREASSFGLERALETRKPQPITMQDLVKVLDELKPSITSKMIKMYDKLRAEYERKTKNKKGKKVKSGKIEKPPAPPKMNFDEKKKAKPAHDVASDIDELESEIDELHSWEDE